MRISKFVIIGSLLAASSSMGCFAPKDACVKTVAERATANALASDASLSLQQAENVISHISNDTVRKEALAYVQEAREALREVADKLSDIDAVCKALDNQALFANFIAIWTKIAPFVAAMTGPNGQPLVTPPLVVTR